MKKIILFALISLLFSCAKGGDDPNEDEILANQTLIFYVQSNNNLYKDLWKDVDEIASNFRRGDRNNVLVFIDSEKGSEITLDESGKWIPKQTSVKNQLFTVNNGKMIPVDGFEEMFKSRSSSDISTFKDVIEYCIDKFPAKKFGLSIGSHGTGWAPINTRSLGGNDFTDRYLEVNDIAKALPIKFEYILFDACLMNDMSTLYELRDKAKYIIASSMNIPSGGFDYSKSLDYLLKCDYEGVCKSYINTWRNKVCATITVTDTKYLNEVAAFNKKIFATYKHVGNSVDELTRIQKCDLNWPYVDYVDFLKIYLEETDNINELMGKLCLYKDWTGVQPYDFKFEESKFSGYSHWINTYGNKWLTAFKSYKWYTDAGADLYMDKINALFL